jgi:ParB family chromosome partitioning protein
MDEGSLYELARASRRRDHAAGAGAPGRADQRYEIIAGERRVRAAQLAGLDEVPVLVKDGADEAPRRCR